MVAGTDLLTVEACHVPNGLSNATCMLSSCVLLLLVSSDGESCTGKADPFMGTCFHHIVPVADAVQAAVSKLISTIKDKPDPFINLIQAGLAETLANALKYGIPANATIFGDGFSGVPAIPGPISDALQILLGSGVKLATAKSAETLFQDFFQVCQLSLSTHVMINVDWLSA